MNTRTVPGRPPAQLRLGARARPSYARLAITDSVLAIAALGVVCGTMGVLDDGRDAGFLIVSGMVALTAGFIIRRTFARSVRPAPGRILSGLALSWMTIVLLGAGVYLATGTIDSVERALVESAAGFSTTAITTVDPSELSVPMQLWRASTQWLGGLLGIIVGVVALPLAFRGRYLSTNSNQPDQLAPTPVIGRRRVLAIYLALTVALGLAYALTGLGTRDSVVHAMTTISTGGFSSQPDSFAGFATGPRIVAVVGMIIGGSSYFLLWWLIRGRLAPMWRSTELRLYAALLAVGSLVVMRNSDDLGLGDAVFTTVSAVTTTGFAVVDWTILSDAALAVLLVLIGTGAMSGSAGGGLGVIRAWMLLGFASRELRRQLDPHAVVVVKQAGTAVDEPTLESTTGYQVAHLGLCAIAAIVVALGGGTDDVTGAIFSGISVLSTHGPAVGTGPVGDLSSWSPLSRLLLLPIMLAGRLSILPLLLAVSSLLTGRWKLVRRARRSSTRTTRR